MMETIFTSGILKAKSKAALLLLFGAFCLPFLVPLASFGQTIALRQHVDVAQPAAFSIDRLSNIYLTDRKNNLFQFNAAGKLINTYSPPRTGRVGNVEAWNAMKVLLFYDDQQRITLLDRFLTNISGINLRDYTNGLIKVATTSADDKIWLFNESEFSLLKFDPRNAEITSTTPLNLTINRKESNMQYIREYQNMVYLVDKTTGIYVFDNLGNYKKTLPLPGLSYVGFRDEEMYFLTNNQLHFFNLYNFKERVLDVPAGPNYRQALVGEELIYLLSDSGLDLFAYE